MGQDDSLDSSGKGGTTRGWNNVSKITRGAQTTGYIPLK